MTDGENWVFPSNEKPTKKLDLFYEIVYLQIQIIHKHKTKQKHKNLYFKKMSKIKRI